MIGEECLLSFRYIHAQMLAQDRSRQLQAAAQQATEGNTEHAQRNAEYNRARAAVVAQIRQQEAAYQRELEEWEQQTAQWRRREAQSLADAAVRSTLVILYFQRW